ncbi:hypothetical protein ACQCSX_04255 [Pseudarthrobacter sp. P1]|uniref:hypothetical protein n=1 Tax=Pseudarthrobacter sp. P1 TaxID=3418418 RepID=UPI003CF53479
MSTSTVCALLYGRYERGHAPYPRVAAKTAAAILAVKPTLDNMAEGALVDPAGSMRRLQALVALGWSQARLAQRLGVTSSNSTHLFTGSRQVTARTARAVRALYDELWNQPQEPVEWRAKIAASRARRKAAQLGWLPPMAWDDETIDDPATAPMAAAVPIHELARVEDVEHLVATGADWGEIIGRLGTTRVALERYLHRQGRGDLVTRAKTMADRRAYSRAS